MIMMSTPQLGLTYSIAQHMGQGLRATLALIGLAAALIWCPNVAQAKERPQALQTIPLRAGMHNIKAQLAITPQQRQIGLMHVTSMGNNEGMLFVFEQPAMQCFWMKNTLIPLQIAFLNDDGTIVNVAEMQPHSLDNTCSERPVRYVLEMNTGWFTKRGLKAGSKLSGEPFRPTR